jgi:hypothetical protein
MESSNNFDALRAFRHSFYECFDRRAGALFELSDAIFLAAGAAPSPVHLSLEAVHRRGWGSLYAALGRGRIDESGLRSLLARCPLTDETAKDRKDRPPIFAVDVSVWPRCDAEASPGRAYYYHPSRHSAGQPIVAGWAYQLVAQLGFARDSWVAPVDARRVRPEEDANEVAVEQAKALLGRLPGYGDAPWFVFDAFSTIPSTCSEGSKDAGLSCSCGCIRTVAFTPTPEHPSPKPVGRPRRHGKKFDLKAPGGTWPTPSAEHSCHEGDYGSVRVRCWAGLHPKTRRIGEGYGCEAAPVVRGTVVLVEVERLPRETRKPKKLWLWWNGVAEPDLDLLWRTYCRRFDLEHTIRFLKQTLGWTTPRVRHPEQADRWTWLILAAYAQLRLAQVVVADRRLPWERSLPRRTALKGLRR